MAIGWGIDIIDQPFWDPFQEADAVTNLHETLEGLSIQSGAGQLLSGAIHGLEMPCLRVFFCEIYRIILRLVEIIYLTVQTVDQAG